MKILKLGLEETATNFVKSGLIAQPLNSVISMGGVVDDVVYY
jgi:hypothetical protein